VQGPVPVDSGTIYYWESEAVFYLGNRFDLGLRFDGSFTVKDYNYIEETGTVGDGKEYRFFGEPGITLNFAATPVLDVQFTLGAEFLRSNSTYLDSISGSADLGCYFYF